MGKYLCDSYKKMQPSAKNLVIYEIGPGTGTLAHTVLDYVKAYEPFIYRTMEYHLIEISPVLHETQKKRFQNSNHETRVHCNRKSFFNMTDVETRQCFVLAFEVLVGRHLVCFCFSNVSFSQDNLAHDRIKYHPDGAVRECLVAMNLTREQAKKARRVDFLRGLPFGELIDKLAPSISLKYDLYR
jgi:hypothetical protein